MLSILHFIIPFRFPVGIVFSLFSQLPPLPLESFLAFRFFQYIRQAIPRFHHSSDKICILHLSLYMPRDFAVNITELTQG